MSLRWYIVHAYSNFEHKVKQSLEERIERMGLQDKFGEILVPTEEVVEMKEGQKRRSERKFFRATCSCKWKWTTRPGTS